jgi:rod shape determining protein RodA
MLIVLLQPDMGTALVFLPIAIVPALMAGAKLRHIMFILLTGILSLGLAVLPSYEKYILGREIAFFYSFRYTRLMLIVLVTIGGIGLLSTLGYYVYKRTYFYWISYFTAVLFLSVAGSLAVQRILKDYQIMRLIIFIDPYIDPRGAGWNILQSITAVGSGGFTGKGFLMGTQSHFQYLPQQSTDFIFSILAEEWGFIGGFFVLLMFFVITFRSIRIITHARDSFAVFTGTGILAMFLLHVVVNVGMAMGIMPITGIPLLFLSRGGSALWTASAGIGIMLNIYMRRYRY